MYLFVDSCVLCVAALCFVSMTFYMRLLTLQYNHEVTFKAEKLSCFYKSLARMYVVCMYVYLAVRKIR
jgi:hypothetical protein